MLRSTEVDGVRVVWVEEPGPLHAQLLVRVGVTDEPLQLRGITHLTEHLAISAIRRPSDLINGHVEFTSCGFSVSGDESDIVRYFKAVTSALHSPQPAERIKHEARVLRAESDAREGGVLDLLTAVRYGARGPGKIGREELFLRDPEPCALTAWAEQHMTRQNTVVWLSGRPPEALRFDLPDGAGSPFPQVTPVPRLVLPGFVRHHRFVGAGFEVNGDPAAQTIALFALVHLFQERARFELGASYQATATSTRLDAASTFEALFADATEGHSRPVVDSLIGTIRAVAEGRHLEDVRRLFLSQLDAAWEHPGASAGLAASNAGRLLRGAPLIDRDEWRQQLAEVDSSSISDVATRLLATATYVVPADADLPAEVATFITSNDRTELPGPTETFLPAVGGGPTRLDIGDGGVALDGPARTVVLAGEAELRVQWHDGAAGVIGVHGASVVVAPQRWERGARAADLIAEVFDCPSMTYGLRFWVPPEPDRAPFLTRAARGARAAHGLEMVCLAVAFVVAATLTLSGFAIGWLPGRRPPDRFEITPGGALLPVEPPPPATDPRTGTAFVVSGIAVTVLALAWCARRGRVRHAVTLIDRAQSHIPEMPDDVSTFQAYVTCGPLLGWLVDRGHTSDWIERSAPEALARFRSREITALELYRELDGILATDLVTPAASKFALWYTRRALGDDLDSVKGGQPTRYHIPDTWEVYDTLAAAIDRRWAAFTAPPWRRALGRS